MTVGLRPLRITSKPVKPLPDRARAEIVGLDGLHLLVVDDHEDTRQLLRVARTNSGADVRTCASSADALATIKSWKPDCIISDVGMPGEDGYELIKKIRALKKKDRAKTPAIALTGFAGADDKSQALAAGYQFHLSKPVDLRNLTSEIARLAQKRFKGKNLMSSSSKYSHQQ